MTSRFRFVLAQIWSWGVLVCWSERMLAAMVPVCLWSVAAWAASLRDTGISGSKPVVPT